MEEMQRAFNKTIIKLQNTSRIAQEQVSQRERLVNQTRFAVNRMMSFFCVLGPKTDRFHPGSAKPASKCHETDAQSHHDSRPASERGDKHFICNKNLFLFSTLKLKQVFLPTQQYFYFSELSQPPGSEAVLGVLI